MTAFFYQGKEQDMLAVREMCYQSAIISTASSLVVLDKKSLTTRDRQIAKKRIKTLKRFLKGHPMGNFEPQITIAEFANWKPQVFPLNDMSIQDQLVINVCE